MKPKYEIKTKLGASVFRVLSRDITAESNRNIFKGNCSYEFDVDSYFGSNLPKLIIRQQQEKGYVEPSV